MEEVSKKVIKIVLIEDYKLTRSGIRAALERYEGIKVVADTESALKGIELVKKFKPNIVLTDINLKDMNGIKATIKIKEAMPETKVIMLTVNQSEKEVISALGAGVNGYCLKDITPEKLIRIIRSINEGAFWIEPKFTSAARKCFPDPYVDLSDNEFKKNYKEILTKRELDVLKLLVKGQSNTQIAQELIVSVHTAKAHICNILQKFEVTDRVQAAVKAVRERVV